MIDQDQLRAVYYRLEAPDEGRLMLLEEKPRAHRQGDDEEKTTFTIADLAPGYIKHCRTLVKGAEALREKYKGEAVAIELMSGDWECRGLYFKDSRVPKRLGLLGLTEAWYENTWAGYFKPNIFDNKNRNAVNDNKVPTFVKYCKVIAQHDALTPPLPLQRDLPLYSYEGQIYAKLFVPAGEEAPHIPGAQEMTAEDVALMKQNETPYDQRQFASNDICGILAAADVFRPSPLVKDAIQRREVARETVLGRISHSRIVRPYRALLG